MKELSIWCLSWDAGGTLCRQDSSGHILQTLLQRDLSAVCTNIRRVIRKCWTDVKWKYSTRKKCVTPLLHVQTCACRRDGPVHELPCQSYDSSRSSATTGPYCAPCSGPVWSCASDVPPSMENSPGQQKANWSRTALSYHRWINNNKELISM